MSTTIDQLKERIEFFKKNIKDYKSGKYDEYKTRADFIDVFFSSLGWDMYNEQKIIEQFREVVREDKIVIDGNRKAPDYSFRIGPHIVFYVEAKKPSVDIKNDPAPALQLRRYAHTRGLALSILTDFEEIAVYDTRIKPDKKDSAHTARVFYCTYDELFSPCKIQDFSSNYDFLLNTFGKQAVLSGSFNKYVEANKKGTTSVDRGFLDLLNRWREKLAESIALKNEDIDEYNLNIVVQKLIDRLIFLRIAEDRLIEKPNLLFELTGEKDIYIRLCNIFAAADLKYNSSLFLSEDWMMALNIEDKVLKEIIDEMYPPQCPYEFSVLPIEILGHAYEQFLGKTIRFSRKTKFGHSIEIEEKPEVRKAGGVYYTPDYIVDYIVENTVGVKLNNRSAGPLTPKGGKVDKGAKPLTPEEVSEIKILDPACGSGSFLIGAYNYLLRYHLEYYLKNKTRREKALSAGIIYESGENSFKLSTKVKSQILVNNIFGVDIDQQAVEVTKLSLLLKVLEDENLEYKDQLFKTEQMHLLPDLSCNIKCGNSLIGSDYYADKNLTMFGTEEMRKVNVFDWEKEFPSATLRERGGKQAGSEVKRSVSEAGGTVSAAEPWGFDCVIGNPPYVDIKGLPESDVKYIFSKFKFSNNRVNLFAAFIERIFSLKNQVGFNFSMIVPTSFLTQESYQQLRKFITQNYSIKKLTRLPNESFGSAAGEVKVDTVIFVITEKNLNNKVEIISYAGYERINAIDPTKAHFHVFIDQSIWEKSENCIWNVNTTETDELILKKCESDSLKLEECADFSLGITPYDKYRGHTEDQIKNKVFHSNNKEDETYQKLLAGNDVMRYEIKWNGEQWIKYGDWLGAARERRFFTEKRIIVKQIIDWSTKRIWATLTEEELYNTQNAFNLLQKNDYKLEYIIAVLNSRLMTFYHKKRFLDEFKMRFQKILIKDCRVFPIKKINFSNKDDVALYDKLISLVVQMLQNKKNISVLKSDNDVKIQQQKIDAIDKQIDRLVYELYGLTEDEIRIVEGE